MFSIGLYVWANHFAGGGFGWSQLRHDRGGFLRGRPLWYAAVVAFLLALPFWGWAYSLACAGSFLIWRTLGWYNAIDAGTNTENWKRDFLVMGARSVLLFPVFMLHGALYLFLLTCIMIPLCYHAAWHWFPRKATDNRIPLAEWFAGAWIGLVFALIG